jgi:hypothetical protein
LHRGPFEWHYFRTKFHENLPSGSEVIGWGHRQTDHLISLLSFLEMAKKGYALKSEAQFHVYETIKFLCFTQTSKRFLVIYFLLRNP